MSRSRRPCPSARGPSAYLRPAAGCARPAAWLPPAAARDLTPIPTLSSTPLKPPHFLSLIPPSPKLPVPPAQDLLVAELRVGAATWVFVTLQVV